MHVRLNGAPLEEVDYFKYMCSQVAADGGCEMDVVHRMNEWYRAWGALKSFLSNSHCSKNMTTSLYGAEAWGMKNVERRNVNVPGIDT